MAWDRDKERKAAKSMSIGSSVFGILFAIVWCATAASMGAWFMLLFGIPFVGLMVYRLVMCIRLSKDEEEKAPPKETEPWERPSQEPNRSGNKYCPYCGFGLQEGYEFCPKCGRRQP